MGDGIDLVLPSGFGLFQNAPNPFNPITEIKYSLPTRTNVRLQIFDLSGRLISTLRDGVVEAPGYHSVVWRGRNQDGLGVSCGTYLYTLEAGGVTVTKKMLFLK